VGDLLLCVPHLAARRQLGAGAHQAAGPRRCEGSDYLGCVGRLHRCPGASACCRGSAKGDAQVEPPSTDHDIGPNDHGLGRSRGGLTTKLHLACEAGQRPLSLIVTAGPAGDRPQFEAVLEAIRVPRKGRGRPRCRPDRVLGDKAYSSRANRAYLRRRGIAATIPEPADQIRNRQRRIDRWAPRPGGGFRMARPHRGRARRRTRPMSSTSSSPTSYLRSSWSTAPRRPARTPVGERVRSISGTLTLRKRRCRPAMPTSVAMLAATDADLRKRREHRLRRCCCLPAFKLARRQEER
jgi:Transposase DDE domain